MIHITINNIEIEVLEETSILEAARSADIYIPTVCSHPDLKPFQSLELSDVVYQGETKFTDAKGATIDSVKGCGICIVEVEGDSKLRPSCKTIAKDGMKVNTENESIQKQRQKNLIRILAEHPHSCLTCSQREGCIPLTDVCPGNVPIEERCCSMLGNCELEKVVDYVGIAPETPRYVFRNLPKITSDPLFDRDYNLCISCGRCVRVCQQVKGVYAMGGVINDNKLIIGTVNGPRLLEAECKFCGSCVEVCPTGALQDKEKGKLKKFSEMVPCRAACPGEVNIPLYLRLVSNGKIQEAAEVIASKLTFPSVLGKICFHPCESQCRRNGFPDFINEKVEPVNIRMIKDFAMSNSILPPFKKPSIKTGKTVAVVGSGPAGLTAAYFLALKGHIVTVYEKESELGGMLRYGIPRYRLPIEVLEKDINMILESDINIKTNVILGKDIDIESIRRSDADAVFLAIGLSKSKLLPLNGNNIDHFHNGIEFLHWSSGSDRKPDRFESKSVIVIGGGNVATDAARTSVRLNAENVTIVCLEQKNEMPAYEAEIIEAEEEGIKIRNGWGIAGIDVSSNDNNLIEVKLKECTRVFDKNGKFSPKYDESVTESIFANEIIVCIGQESDEQLFTEEIEKSVFANGLIKVNPDTLETNIKGVFAGGDIVSGPASVINAVGYGRKAARSIDRFLGGNGIIDDDEEMHQQYEMYIGREEGFVALEREKVSYVDAEKRRLNFNPFEITYDETSAIKEGSRCLRCDLRMILRHNPSPPEKYLKFVIENIENVPSKEGVIQLLDDKKIVYNIKGSDNMQKILLEKLDNNEKAAYFIYEADPMFTKRESELLQQFLQKYGKLPDTGDELDDLY